MFVTQQYVTRTKKVVNSVRLREDSTNGVKSEYGFQGLKGKRHSRLTKLCGRTQNNLKKIGV